MDCNRCLNKCDYREDILMIPCEACIHKEKDSNSKICFKCINEKCKFKKQL